MSIGLHAQLACIWEATARKPGNVHRGRDFADMTYLDFIMSAAAIAPVMDRAPTQRVGQTILDAVKATRQVTSTNTNLGIILLFAPLATVPEGTGLKSGVTEVLANLNVEDARLAYQAIRLAQPGGLGKVEEQDVSEEPTLSLREVMALGAERDMIAKQYISGFSDVFSMVKNHTELRLVAEIEKAIICYYLFWLRNHPDSLIVRKHGIQKAARLQQEVDEMLWNYPSPKELSDLDIWLRAEGLNPGTSADLTAACLFVALRLGIITVPPQFPWSLTSSA